MKYVAETARFNNTNEGNITFCYHRVIHVVFMFFASFLCLV